MNCDDIFRREINRCAHFIEAVDVVRKNSSGDIWLIGGAVYRTLVHALYHTPKPAIDLDFIVEYETNGPNLENGWVQTKNRFGNPKLINGKVEIDYIPLDKIYSIIKRKMTPKIENYLSGVPLKIAAIAYDVKRGKLVDGGGLEAIKNRKVAVNNFFFANIAARKKGLTLREFILKKAASLNFTPTFPDGI